ncbi:DUF6799 domain-containing protein [Pseudocnuella soli]|uniref:DUF6799 domain-containing protein n=1 Tax=Pseudocnuella soli TaxID=2502779 RepID=UPI0010452E31|nr:DUF6799 domain-containing protein [Pseudocnuella soli]
MKKIFALAFAAVSLAACNDGENATVSTETTTVPETTTMDTMGAAATTSDSYAYAPSEGDVTRRGDDVMVYRNGAWVEADNDVRLDDGVVVYRDGRVTRDGNEVVLEDGEVVSKTGRFFDRAGNAIENAWDKTKSGVKKAGKEVGDAARKAGDKIENAVDNDRE